MIIRSISIENWGPYRGLHQLNLSNKIYGIIGKHESDEGRSNWLGKTWFLSAIRFALYGTRPDNVISEDMCITDGESKTFVELSLDDGFKIVRSRKRGSSTQLEVATNEGKSRQSQAQDIINRHVGMDQNDFVASCFVGQKQIAKLILVRPSERTKIVNNWFDLEKLQKAELLSKDRLNSLLSEIADLEIAKRSLDENMPNIDRRSVENDIHSISLESKVHRKSLDELNERLDELDEWIRHDARYQQYLHIEEKGLRLTDLNKRKFDQNEYSKVKAREKDLYSEWKAAELKYDSMKDLQTGETEFDGKCPVTCTKCLDPDGVRELVTKLDQEVGTAEILADEAQSEYEAIKIELSKFDKYVERRNKIDMLRNEIIGLSDSYLYIKDKGRPEDPSRLRNKVRELVARISDLDNRYHDLSNRLSVYDDYTYRLKKIDKELGELNKQVKIAQEVVAVFGRNGVQRIIAEGAIKEIELDANQSLIDAGIDLSIEVTWSRIGKGVATHCETCGSPFPVSRKIKVCSHCKAVRGPKVVNELDIVPSDRSGAADDIAGLEFQLAAAKWLRLDRGSEWSTVLIDEPFGALDKTNGTLLSTHLHSIIRNQYSFDQGFIVAHDSAIMSSLPAIIQVTGTDSGSRIEVIDGT